MTLRALSKSAPSRLRPGARAGWLLRRVTGAIAPAALLALAIPFVVGAQTPAEADSAAAEARKEGELPLIPTRTLDFTTSEGTWMSLDLSPDGSTIVFELLGDLYTLPVGGGQATRITEGQGYDMQPRYSPDGGRLVFVSDRNGSENLWVSDADGTDARALTTGERDSYVSPVWTPDGDYVMTTKGSQLWLYHRLGGSGVQVTGRENEGNGNPPGHFGPMFGQGDRYVWVNLRGSLGGGFDDEAAPGAEHTPDDHARAEAGRPRPVDDPAVPPRSSARLVGDFQIGQLDRETGRVLVRTHELEGAFRPLPSPDGRWVVYATRWDDREALKLLDTTTGADQWLLMDVQRDESQGGGTRDRDVFPGAAWTPDSRAIVANVGGKIARVEVPSGRLTDIPFTAHVRQELGPRVHFQYPMDDSTFTVSQIRGARPSPDGRRVVFSALDRLWVADLPAGLGGPPDSTAAVPVIRNPRRLTGSDDVEHAPVWSPDGRWIAYVTWNDSTGGALRRVRADGSASPELLTTTPAFWDKPAWSPDGRRIVAARGSLRHRLRTLEDFGGHSGAAELEYVWIPAEGGEPTRIAWVGSGATEEGRNAPHFGPDPDRIYVWADRDGLLSMRWDGTDRKTVVKVSGPPASGPGSAPTPDEVVLSPDGKRALVRANRNVYLITVPPVGGDAPTVSLGGSSVVPTWRLTKVGGDFVGWRPDGKVAHWSIGRSFFQHDVAAADSLRADSLATARATASAERADSADTGDSGDTDAADPAMDAPGRTDGAAYAPKRVDVELVRAKDKPRGVVALTGARLITMRGDEVIESGDILVRDNRIVALGPSGTVDIPAGAERIDVRGRTILPGLVDVHAHTWVAWGVHRSQISQFLAQLAYGVTTQRDPQTSSADVLAYADRMELGELIGPRLYSTGPGIFSADDIDSLEEARDVVRRYADHYDTKTIKQYLAGDRKVRQWVAIAAREMGLTPTTEGGSNFTMNLTLMQDGYSGLEHALPISPFYRDVIELERFSGITYTPTLIVAYGGPSGRQYWLTHTDLDAQERLRTFTPHDELDKWQATQWYRDDQYVHPLHARQLSKLVEAGGRVGLGSHGEVQGLGTHWELWMLASGGMGAHDALRIATLTGAEAIGLDGDIGSLEPGKMADLQILERNPLEDLRNSTSITHVMKNGRLYEADSLTEVWPRRRELAQQWWLRLEPGADVPSAGVGR